MNHMPQADVIDTSKRRAKPTKTCATCPADIPSLGGKKFCPACSDERRRQTLAAYSARKRAKRSAD